MESALSCKALKALMYGMQSACRYYQNWDRSTCNSTNEWGSATITITPLTSTLTLLIGTYCSTKAHPYPALKNVLLFPSLSESVLHACSNSSSTSSCGLLNTSQWCQQYLACCSRGTTEFRGQGRPYPCTGEEYYMWACAWERGSMITYK